MKPAVISHRGASAYLPEHSLAAYRLAIDLGTDYIEPDLVLSSDGIFFALHDILLDDTTNVSEFPHFRERFMTRVVDGESISGYFVSDFTSDEIKSLRVKQRSPATRATLSDNMFEIPSLDEIFNLVNNINQSDQYQSIGIYIELKHPNFYHSIGYNMDDMILQQLTKSGYKILGCESSLRNPTVSLPIIIQCFDSITLQSLRKKSDLPLVQLINTPSKNINTEDYWDQKLAESVQFSFNGIGSPISLFTSLSKLSVAQYMINKANDRAVAVHAYTLPAQGIRANISFTCDSDNTFPPGSESWYFMCCLGVDGVFIDAPDQAVQIRRLMLSSPFLCRPDGSVPLLSSITHASPPTDQCAINETMLVYLVGIICLMVLALLHTMANLYLTDPSTAVKKKEEIKKND
mmetsp:Transcript_24584/g.24822  ORF Transcript_24584/g.24822 Transcript_24584/m.24822 type:complete len:405 (-) Transcript_24584:78-1292(-)